MLRKEICWPSTAWKASIAAFSLLKPDWWSSESGPDGRAQSQSRKNVDEYTCLALPCSTGTEVKKQLHRQLLRQVSVSQSVAHLWPLQVDARHCLPYRTGLKPTAPLSWRPRHPHTCLEPSVDRTKRRISFRPRDFTLIPWGGLETGVPKPTEASKLGSEVRAASQ